MYQRLKGRDLGTIWICLRTFVISFEAVQRFSDVPTSRRSYPVAYCFCVLPVSAARWSAFVSGDDSVPSGATFFAIFARDLFGAVNVLLLLVTRPGLLILQDPRRNNAEGALPNNASFDGPGSSSELGQAHSNEKK